MKKFNIIIVALILIHTTTSAQKETFNWYFGSGAGITFNTPDFSPVALTDGAMYADEGSAVISDAEGNLLFYTNGEQIWNRKHEIMLNGDELEGGRSSTQSSLIVKQPGHDNLYYIFTTDEYITGVDAERSLYYGIVDMDQDEGYGQLVGYYNLYTPSTEKLAAVMHSNNKDIWILMHEYGNDIFNIALLTDSGLKHYNRFSLGSVHEDVVSDKKYFGAIGYMKFSPDGKKLALTVHAAGALEIFDFDNSTGELTNPVLIDNIVDYGLYGLEFSPDASKLYVSNSSYLNPGLWQLDLSSPDKNHILNSICNISDSSTICRALQSAPDGKIYVVSGSGSDSLSVINYPNLKNYNCDLEYNALYLGGRKAAKGLPNFIANQVSVSLFVSGESVCSGEEIYLSTKMSLGAEGDYYQWTGPNGFSSDDTNIIIYNAGEEHEGWYYVKSELLGKEYYDSVYIEVYDEITDIFEEKEISVCGGETINLSAYNEDFNSYLWSNGDTLSNIEVKQSGTYYVTVTDIYGCSGSDTVTISFYPKPVAQINDGADTINVCSNDGVKLSSFYDAESYIWSTTEEEREITVTETGRYYLIVKNDEGCKDTAKVEVIIRPAVEPVISGQEIICPGDSSILSLTEEYAGYEWSDGSTESTLIVKESGDYSVKVTNEYGCEADAFFKVSVYEFGVSLDKDEIIIDTLILDWNKSLPLTINNDGNLPVEYSSVLLNGDKFWLGGSKQGSINAGNSKNITLVFDPKNIGEYSDTIHVSITSPCSDEFYIPVKGTAYVYMEASLPERKANVGEKVCFPLNARLKTELDISDSASYTALISIDAEAMLTDKAYVLDDGYQKITMNSITKIDNELREIGELCGTVAIGKQDQSPVAISDFTWDNQYVIPLTEDGSLKITGLCVRNLSRNQYFETTEMSVSPQPAGELINITVSSGEIGSFELKLYNLQGAEIYAENWQNSEKGSREINIDTENLSTGNYTVILKAGTKVLSESIFVRK